MQFKRGQTWRNRAGTHVHVVSVNNGRAMLTLNEYDPMGIIYTVDASGNALFNDRAGDLIARVQRVYIAGPMTGLPELNFPLFNETAQYLRALGAHVENPAEIPMADGVEWHEAMRADIPRLLTCDTLRLLPGWEKSRGATLEYNIATALGMTVVYPEPVCPPGWEINPADGKPWMTEATFAAEKEKYAQSKFPDLAPCCRRETRTMNGGCSFCGDPCY